MPHNKSYQGLLLTDLDGTIKPGPGRGFCEKDLLALEDLGRKGWFRAVATGRSLFSFVQAWEPGLELDALIYSSGAGLCLWDGFGPGELLLSRTFSQPEAARAVEAALALGRGFYAYQAPPDSHHFYYHRSPTVPRGFQLRIDNFQAQTSPWPGFENLAGRMLSQLLIMVPWGEADRIEAEFHQAAPGLSVLRSSSPFEDGHLWLEIFPPEVSKGRTAAALAGRLGLGPDQSVALGNDFNDLDLLSWAGRAYVTEDAPSELTGLYPTITPAGQGGLAQAANLFAPDES